MIKLILILIILIFIVFKLNLNYSYFLGLLIIIILITLFFINNYNYSWMLIYNFIGIDYIRFNLILLRLWIIRIIFLINQFYMVKLYNLILLLLLIFLLITFRIINFFIFYLFFEISIIPTFILIIGWGYQPERINARIYIIIYTLFASLPLIVILFKLIFKFKSLRFFFLLNNIELILNINLYIYYFYILFAFLVKIPIFLFHLWLTKAHTEAPVAGSMILAGIILKLGGYGLIRVNLIINYISLNLYKIIISIRLVRLIYISILCLRQVDFKLLIAYSSVVHIRIIIIGILTMKLVGIKGGLIIIIGHGLCSSGLFLIINIIYKETLTRNIIINKGLINYYPRLILFIFILCVFNISAPISLNLLRELIIIMRLMNYLNYIIIILIFGIMLRSAYSLYLFSILRNLNYRIILNKIKLIKINNYIQILFHLIPLNIFILKYDLLFYLNNLIKILICGIKFISKRYFKL